MKIFGLLILLGFCSCGSNESKQYKSLPERLNGNSYESSNTVAHIPVMNKEIPAKRKISGTVFCGEGLSQVPSNGAHIEVKDGVSTIATTLTDGSGNFAILAKFRLGSHYTVNAKSSCGSVEQDIAIASGNEQKPLSLFLK